MGDGFSIAWRTYDAQYWGVPQRRKRIYLIADFTGERAGEILFEPESMSGDSEQGTETGKGSPGNVAGSIGRSSGTSSVVAIQGNLIDRNTNQNGCVHMVNHSPTLNTIDRHGVCYPVENHAADSRVTLQTPGTPCQTLTSRMGTGGGNVPLILSLGNGQLHDAMRPTETARTLNTMHDHQAVIVENSSGNGIAATLDASYYKGTGSRNGEEREYVVLRSNRKYIIRRLTPLECCRLQGFPDWWEEGVTGSDSARYKMWGNGIALPCAQDVLRRIAEHERKEETDGKAADP